MYHIQHVPALRCVFINKKNISKELNLTRKLLVFAAEGVAAVLQVAGVLPEPGELGLETAVLSVSVVQVRRQLVHATGQVGVGRLGVLQPLGQVHHSSLSLW